MIGESSDTRISVVRDPETETYRARFGSRNVAPSIATVEVMARVCDTDTTELPPVAEVIEPEALDMICTPKPGRDRDGDRVVEFTYFDHVVRIKSYGVIEVERDP